MSIHVLRRDDLLLGGFAGLKEHRLVVDERLGFAGSGTWNGLGDFVYLADASFLPDGETTLHLHKEVDVISIMVKGRILHEGSLEDGKSMEINQVQVQRAGGEGFMHNEVNPDARSNRMIQLWALPEKKGQCSGYKFYNLKQGQLTCVYGGKGNQDKTFSSSTIVEVGIFNKGQEINKKGMFMAYVVSGSGTANTTLVREGDLIRGSDLCFSSVENVQLIVISLE